ncbi:MAG: acyltransferase [Pseudolabrys sp.]
MKKPVSLYLDLVRFLAAVAVVLSHLGSRPFSEGVVTWRMSSYGTIAVTVFFVLSGYVIAYVASTRETNAASYFGARIARLYSVLLLALGLTFTFDKFGMAVDPSLYLDQKLLLKPESWQGYLSILFLVNEFQIFHFNGISAGTNGPLWSLSFEAAYYVIAGLVLFTKKSFWLPASAVILVLAGRTITALLPVWALGYLIYNMNIRTKIPKTILAGGALLTVCLIAQMPRFSAILPSDNFGFYMPWGRGPFDRNLAADYLVAILFAINLVCVQNLFGAETNIPLGAERFVKWVSALTFPLYCTHYPALCLFTAIRPWPASSVGGAVFEFALVMCLAAAVTPLCDRLKYAIRDIIIRVTLAKTRVAK